MFLALGTGPALAAPPTAATAPTSSASAATRSAGLWTPGIRDAAHPGRWVREFERRKVVLRAPGPEAVLGLLGALVVLGFVYCNPDVVQVGPSRVYPVDLGGLDPALLGSGRSRESEAAP